MWAPAEKEKMLKGLLYLPSILALTYINLHAALAMPVESKNGSEVGFSSETATRQV